jgi:hypothetical protein
MSKSINTAENPSAGFSDYRFSSLSSDKFTIAFRTLLPVVHVRLIYSYGIHAASISRQHRIFPFSVFTNVLFSIYRYTVHNCITYHKCKKRELMTTLHWMINSDHYHIMEKQLDSDAISGIDSLMNHPESEKAMGGMDTEATSETDATARYDYTGIYRLSTMYDESRLESSITDLESLGGYIALRPDTVDEYNVAIAVHQKSFKILTARLFVSQCLDYMPTSLDQGDSPYDDIIGIRSLQWMNNAHVVDIDDTTQRCSTNDVEEQERIQSAFEGILTKCDMIRFMGNILVLEGPKGAIECITE